jgi:hypothetical protein
MATEKQYKTTENWLFTTFAVVEEDLFYTTVQTVNVVNTYFERAFLLLLCSSLNFMFIYCRFNSFVNELWWYCTA